MEETNQIITTYDKKIAAIGFKENTITINGSQKDIYAHAIQRDNVEYLPISEMKDVYASMNEGVDRLIFDYVAGMSDNFALDCANEILKPEHLNDKIELSQRGKWFDA